MKGFLAGYVENYRGYRVYVPESRDVVVSRDVLFTEVFPKCYKEAVNSCDSNEWKLAMQDEMQSLLEHGTWILVEKPENVKIIGSKWVYSFKRNDDGSGRYKARLVGQSFSQIIKVDFNEISAPWLVLTHLDFLSRFLPFRVFFRSI